MSLILLNCRLKRDQNGAVLILASIMFPLMVILTAIVIDWSITLSETSSAQGAADNAARSAAVVAWLDSPASGVPAAVQQADVLAEARAIASANGFPHGGSRTLSENIQVTAVTPPVISTLYGGNQNVVEVVIRARHRNFLPWRGIDTATIYARAVGNWQSSPCIIALGDGTGSTNGVISSGNTNLIVPCGVYSNNLNTPGSVITNGQAFLQANTIISAGSSVMSGNNFGSSTILVNDAEPMSNPYSGGIFPQVSVASNGNVTVSSISPITGSTSSLTFTNANRVDCGSQNTPCSPDARANPPRNVITKCCVGNVTFPAGVYYFIPDQQNKAIQLTGNTSIDATGGTNSTSPTGYNGVTFVLPPTATVNVAGNTSLNIVPPVAATATGINNFNVGISIYQPNGRPSCNGGATSCPNANNASTINGGSATGLNGALILPGSDLTVAGSSTNGGQLSSLTGTCLSFIGWTVNISGGGNIGSGCPAKSVNASTFRGGFLIE